MIFDIKAKVDTAQNVLAIWPRAPNADFPGALEITDEAVREGFTTYSTVSTEILKECRQRCFCILSHGAPKHFMELNKQESIELITNAYRRYGRSRQLLLLSCLTGLHLARQLSGALGATVIAATGIAAISKAGEILCIPDWYPAKAPPQGADLSGALNWVKITPKGEIIMAGDAALRPSFVNEYHIPPIDIVH